MGKPSNVLFVAANSTLHNPPHLLLPPNHPSPSAISHQPSCLSQLPTSAKSSSPLSSHLWVSSSSADAMLISSSTSCSPSWVISPVSSMRSTSSSSTERATHE